MLRIGVGLVIVIVGTLAVCPASFAKSCKVEACKKSREIIFHAREVLRESTIQARKFVASKDSEALMAYSQKRDAISKVYDVAAFETYWGCTHKNEHDYQVELRGLLACSVLPTMAYQLLNKPDDLGTAAAYAQDQKLCDEVFKLPSLKVEWARTANEILDRCYAQQGGEECSYLSDPSPGEGTAQCPN